MAITTCTWGREDGGPYGKGGGKERTDDEKVTKKKEGRKKCV
jgi:hypothetical protein